VSKVIQSWRLFWALAALVSVAIALKLPGVDLHTDKGVLQVVHRAVRCALPFFLVAFSASSLAVLFPGAFTRWLLANRRYFGLAFAVGMLWHFSFIALLALRGHEFTLSFVLALDFIGAAFLAAMTVTSFPRLSRWLGPAGWRRLHKTGAYTIWALATYIYLQALPAAHGIKGHLPVAALLAAGLLRVAAKGYALRPRRSIAGVAAKDS
jgi:methionine sulfoxide reductase heme-binding subunit